MSDPIRKLYQLIFRYRVGAHATLSDRLFNKLFAPTWLLMFLVYGFVFHHFKTELEIGYGIGSYGFLFGCFFVIGLANLAVRLFVRSIIGVVRTCEAEREQ